MVASNRLGNKHESHLVPIPDSSESVLRTAVIYGANGAGKSNLFRALRYFKDIALLSARNDGGMLRDAFQLGDAGETSDFDLQFIASGNLYRFGFKINDTQVVEEWLVQVIKGREKVLFERTTGADGRIKINVGEIEDQRIKALATVGGPKSQTFLSTIHATLDEADITGEIKDVLLWLRDNLILISPQQNHVRLVQALSDTPSLLSFAGDFLMFASTGMIGLKITESDLTEDELLQLPRNIPTDFLIGSKENNGQTSRRRLGLTNTDMIQRQDGKFSRIKIQAEHESQGGDTMTLDLAEESDGTRRLINLIPALHHLRSADVTYFIDEIDRSLHPHLVRAFLESFLESCGGGRRQIIVTTHESSLLDQELIRRDEIWFAEKDTGGSTRLYSLLDFKIRNDLEIRKHYLQGRFGAIPFLGNVDKLCAEQNDRK